MPQAYRRIIDEEREASAIITDPRLEDNPIVFANDAFVRLTGYDRDEILWRNCRFLQGKDTNPETVRALREAIERGDAINVGILNFRKDGTPFWNRLRIRPMLSEGGEIENFMGLQNPIDASERRTEPVRGIQD